MCIIDPFTLCSLNNLKYEVAFCIKSHFYWRPVGFCSSHIVVWPKTTKCMLMASLFFKILYRTYHVHFLRLSSSPGLLANTGLSPTPPPNLLIHQSHTLSFKWHWKFQVSTCLCEEMQTHRLTIYYTSKDDMSKSRRVAQTNLHGVPSSSRTRQDVRFHPFYLSISYSCLCK